MSKLNISIFGNKIFSEILSEVKLFYKYDFQYYDKLDLCVKDAQIKNQLVIFYIAEKNKNLLKNLNIENFPKIFITETHMQKKIPIDALSEHITLPIKILNLEKKLVSLIAKNKFRKNSLISLGVYMIDKNERKLKKGDLTLQLSEKEVDFLILFSENKKPVTRNLVLQKVWNYSPESETHTVETHIHRLRKKILNKFGDNNLIKNNNNGYYI
tara:strand:- start:192 stop:830 length:639 start_codon:yes stop_codon:yes gene_type:complete